MGRSRGTARGGELSYVEAEADTDIGEVARRQLLAHILDGPDDVGQGEGYGHGAGGEGAGARRLHRRIHGEPGWSVLKEPEEGQGVFTFRRCFKEVLKSEAEEESPSQIRGEG